MDSARPIRPLRAALVRAAVLAAMYAVLLCTSSAGVGEVALASAAAFAALLAFGCLLHWRDVLDAARARSHRERGDGV